MSKKISLIAKGLAILGVVLYHLQYDLVSLNYLIARNEGLSYFSRIFNVISQDLINIVPFLMYLCLSSVSVFFILSGFGLMKKYSVEKLTLKKWAKQIWKILLPYFIAIPVTFLINYFLQWIWTLNGINESMPKPFDIYQPMQYLESFLVFTRWFDDRLALNFVGTWWFVGIILQFYLLFPLLFMLFKKIGSKKFLILSLVITVLYRLVVVYTTDDSPVGIQNANLLMFINFPARLAEFALGMYFATCEKYLGNLRSLILGIISLIIGFIVMTFNWGLAINEILIGFGAFQIITCFAKLIFKLKIPIIDKVGKYSYHIYLFHEPALKMIAKLVYPYIG